MVALGCNDFLPKPILEADLSQVLVRQLGVQFLYSSPDIDGQLPDQTETAHHQADNSRFADPS